MGQWWNVDGAVTVASPFHHGAIMVLSLYSTIVTSLSLHHHCCALGESTRQEATPSEKPAGSLGCDSLTDLGVGVPLPYDVSVSFETIPEDFSEEG